MPMKRSLEERIERKTVPVTESGCHIWLGATVNGYAKLRYEKKLYLVHRLVYERAFGKITQGLEIDHLCRVRCCINVHHLEPVTKYENQIRGNTLTYWNLLKTHCPLGHPYAGSNLIRQPRGARACRKCMNDNRRGVLSDRKCLCGCGQRVSPRAEYRLGHYWSMVKRKNHGWEEYGA